MKFRVALVLVLVLPACEAARADSSRRREVVDLTRLELLRTISKGWTHSLSPSGHGFAVFDANVVRLIDTVEGREYQTLNGHTGLIHDSGWSRDGRQIATAGYDAAVRVWDVTTGKSLPPLYPHAGYACSVAFSADSKWVATGGSEDGMIKIFEAATGRAVRTIQTPDVSIYAVAFTADGRHVVVNHSLANRADSSMRVFKTADGSEVKNLVTGAVSAFALSRDGRLLAYSNARGTILILETGGWTEIKRLDGHQTGASSLAFHPISRYLASTAPRDGAVRIWDTDTGKVINSVNVKGETDSRLVFGADGLTLVVSSTDATVRVFGRPEGAGKVNAGRPPAAAPDGQPGK
jgi:WD40 repeat protein